MRWFIAAVALTVICAMFGSAAALVLGGAALKLPRTDRPVLSLKAKGSPPRDLSSGQPNSLTVAKSAPSVAAQPIEQ
jgi:hypothetical protein